MLAQKKTQADKDANGKEKMMKKAPTTPAMDKKQLESVTAKAKTAEWAAKTAIDKAQLAKAKFKAVRKAYKQAKKAAKKAAKLAKRAQKELQALKNAAKRNRKKIAPVTLVTSKARPSKPLPHNPVPVNVMATPGATVPTMPPPIKRPEVSGSPTQKATELPPAESSDKLSD